MKTDLQYVFCWQRSVGQKFLLFILFPTKLYKKKLMWKYAIKSMLWLALLQIPRGVLEKLEEVLAVLQHCLCKSTADVKAFAIITY